MSDPAFGSDDAQRVYMLRRWVAAMEEGVARMTKGQRERGGDQVLAEMREALRNAAIGSRALKWPQSKRVSRPDDMSPDGQLTVGLDNDNDVYVSIFDGKHPSVTVEFCNGGGGGGRSPRTRAALIELMTAMEADAAGVSINPEDR